MSAAVGVVAIETPRLEALADALLRVADQVLEARLDAYELLDGGVPAEVDDLGRVSSRLRLLGLDTRRRLDIIRYLPWDLRPVPTHVALGRDVRGPYLSVGIVEDLVARYAHLYGGDATATLDHLLAVGADPYEAAAALQALGVDGFRKLYHLAERETYGRNPADEARLPDRIEAVTGLLFAASRTVDHPGGLPRSFIDELLPGVPVPGDRAIAPDDFGPLPDLLTAAGAGQYLVETASAAATGGVATVITHAGRVIAVAGLAVGVLDGLANGGEGLVENVITGGLALWGAVVGGPAGWLATGLSLVLTCLFSADGRGRPPGRTYPSDQSSPGGHGSETWIDGSGAPVPHAGG